MTVTFWELFITFLVFMIVAVGGVFIIYSGGRNKQDAAPDEDFPHLTREHYDALLDKMDAIQTTMNELAAKVDRLEAKARSNPLE